MSWLDSKAIGGWAKIRPVAWRSALVVIVIAIAMAALAMGVEFSERPGISSGNFFTKFYYVLGLFVLGGLDLGIPIGGSSLARGLMWLAYFGAPTITGLAVLESLLRTISPERFRLRNLRGHIVVAGDSPIAQLYIRRLHEAEFRKRIVWVLPVEEKAPALPQNMHVLVVQGDIRSEATLELLRLSHAERVFLGADDGYLNLDAASKILSRVPEKAGSIVLHVANLSLLRAISNTRVARECSIFNSHQIAASHLVQSELIEWFDHTAEDDVVVLGGFGRFGQTVLSELQTRAKGRFGTVIVVDPDAQQKCDIFSQESGFDTENYELIVVDGDVSCPSIWQELETRCALSQHSPAFVLGCGDDTTNILAALRAAQTCDDSRIVARVFRSSSFTEELASEHNMHVISVSQLAQQSMPQHWFRPEKKSRN